MPPSGFGDMPAMTLSKVGYGMGTKDFERANCVRMLLGEATGAAGGEVSELRCNLDDMTGEQIAFAVETLLACLCPPEREGEFAALMLRHTTTLGVRCQALRRYVLEREPVALDTPWGPVRGKRSRGYGVDRVKPEYDDLAALARREGVPLLEILKGVGAGGEE